MKQDCTTIVIGRNQGVSSLKLRPTFTLMLVCNAQIMKLKTILSIDIFYNLQMKKEVLFGNEIKGVEKDHF